MSHRTIRRFVVASALTICTLAVSMNIPTTAAASPAHPVHVAESVSTLEQNSPLTEDASLFTQVTDAACSADGLIAISIAGVGLGFLAARPRRSSDLNTATASTNGGQS